ncbi:hypothetical protein ACHQM5_023949 [Ranunculus cassubicifolius]
MQSEEKKQAAADVLYQYSQFAMVCLGERVRPCDLRLHLMKEISGMPSCLTRETTLKARPSPDITGEPSSSSASRGDRSDISPSQLL